jgi:SnoaL-like polyketide cyclase
MSDAEITVDGLAIDGDKIVAHGELHGTHDGALAELAATGTRVRVQYVIFTRIDDGKSPSTGTNSMSSAHFSSSASPRSTVSRTMRTGKTDTNRRTSIPRRLSTVADHSRRNRTP